MRFRLLLGLLLFCSGYLAADEPRMWASRAGGFSVEASLVDLIDGNVVLKKSDGTTIKVPLEKLSLGDVRYINQVIRDAEDSINRPPAKTAETSAQAAGAAPPEAELDDRDDESMVDTRAQAPALAEANRSQWQVSPDIGNIRLVKAAKNLSIPVATTYGALQTVIPDVASPYVGIFQQASPSRLIVHDIRSGRKIGQVELGSGYLQHKCLSPDGRLFAWYMPGQKSIQIAATAGSKQLIELELPTQFASINYVAFAAPDRLLVGNVNEQKLSLWDTKARKKLHEFAMPTGTDEKLITLSHGGNYLALASRVAAPIRIYDVRNGALAGVLEMPTSQPGSGVIASTESVAFSLDGKEMAVLYRQGTSARLVLSELKNGSVVKDYEIDRPSSLLSVASYEGPVLQFLPEEKGWLLYGRAVIDRQIGGIAWVEPSVSGFVASGARRRVLVDGRIVGLRGTSSAVSLTAEALPWNEIEQGSKVVARGGTSEDANLPELSQPMLDLADQKAFVETDQWRAVEPAAEKRSLKARPIALSTPPLLLKDFQFATSADSCSVLVVAPSKSKPATLENGFHAAELTRFDLEQGRLLGTLDTNQPGEYVDFTSSGTWALTRTGKMRDRLDVFEIESGKHVGGFRPNASEKQTTMIAWAGFADDDSLVTLTYTGRMVSWEVPDFRARAVTQLDIIRRENFVPITCWKSPSRTILIVAAAGNLQAVDAKSLQPLGTLESTSNMRGPWQALAVAFDPSGRWLAAEIKNGDKATIAVWDFTTGRLSAEYAIERPSLGLTWADDRYLIVHGIRMPNSQGGRYRQPGELTVLDLIDSQRGALVWRYVVPFGQLLQRGPDQRIWYASSTAMIHPAALMGVELPTPAAVAAIGKLPPRTPILESGSQITLDVKFQALGTPAGIDLLTDSIQADLSRQLIDRGVEVKPRTGLVLVVSIQEKQTDQRLRFIMLASGQETSIQETRIDCELVLKDVTGKVLWQRSQAFFNEGQRLIESVPAGTSASDHLRRLQWQEVLQWLQAGGLPEKVYEPFPANGLGESMLGPTGETNVKTY